MPSERRMLKEFQELINQTIYDFCDCSICGICCKDEALDITIPDANRISKNLKIDKKTFYEKYTYHNQETNEISMNMPCPFLKDNRCTIYSIRPDMCRNYPVFVLEDGLVFINEIYACAAATHFYEAFLDYLEKYYPDCYQQHMRTPVEKEPGKRSEDEKVIRVCFSIRYIALFIEWLNEPKK